MKRGRKKIQLPENIDWSQKYSDLAAMFKVSEATLIKVYDERFGHRKPHPGRSCNGHARRKKKAAEYTGWRCMIDRCTNPRNKNYQHYGGRGIRVCQRWMDSFPDFIADMGQTPGKGFSIDRIDTLGNYEPNNCRWATQSEQCKNKGDYPLTTRNNLC